MKIERPDGGYPHESHGNDTGYERFMDIDEGSTDQIFYFLCENLCLSSKFGRGVIQNFENTENLTLFPLPVRFLMQNEQNPDIFEILSYIPAKTAR